MANHKEYFTLSPTVFLAVSAKSRPAHSLILPSLLFPPITIFTVLWKIILARPGEGGMIDNLYREYHTFYISGGKILLLNIGSRELFKYRYLFSLFSVLQKCRRCMREIKVLQHGQGNAATEARTITLGLLFCFLMCRSVACKPIHI